jgi:hypothetical protein
MAEMIIRIVKGIDVGLLEMKNSLFIVDEFGEALAGRLGVKDFLKVERADAVSLEDLHREIHTKDYLSIVGIGGAQAVNSAKILSLPRLPHKILREIIYENKPPAKRVTIIPTVPSLCTDVTRLVLFYDPRNPAWLMRRLAPTTAITTPQYLQEAAQDCRTKAIAMDVYLSSSMSQHTGTTYLWLCNNYEKLGPGPVTVFMLTLASVFSISLDALAREAAKLNVREAFEKIRREEDPYLWMEEEAMFRERKPKLYKKMDLLVEHAWTFYSLQLRKYGFRGKTDVYKFFRSLLTALSI